MRFTVGDLRGSIADPGSTIARLRSSLAAAKSDNTPRSPQRSWIEASLRRYYISNRNPDILIGDYQTRTAGKGASLAKRSEIANGESLLHAFLTKEEAQPNPRLAMQPRVNQLVAGHILSMGHDLIYERPDGYLVREIWTDGIVRRPTDRRLMAAACLLHAEQVFGIGRVKLLEGWQLRMGIDELITRAEAKALEPALKAALDAVARALQT